MICESSGSSHTRSTSAVAGTNVVDAAVGAVVAECVETGIVRRVLCVGGARGHVVWRAPRSSPDSEFVACLCRDLLASGNGLSEEVP